MAIVTVQTPDNISLSGNLKELILQSSDPVDVKLTAGGATLLDETYYPGNGNLIHIDLSSIVKSHLSFSLPSSDVFLQPSIAKTFTLAYGTTTSSFRCIRSGKLNLTQGASAFLTGNFLTWQPNQKPVTYYSPEWLTYYAVHDCSIRLKAYWEDGTDSTITLVSPSAGNCYTLNMQYAVVSGKFAGKRPMYYDVWVEGGGSRLSYIQRYVASEKQGEDENWYLFENSLGGLDSLRAYGALSDDPEYTHNIANFGDKSEEYRIDANRLQTRNTGYLTPEEARWLQDLFVAPFKYLYTISGVYPIVFTSSDATTDSANPPSSYSFTYRMADTRPYLDIQRRTDLPENLQIPIPTGETFFLPPRLAEHPKLELSADLLILAQEPHTEAWGTITTGAVHDSVLNDLVRELDGLELNPTQGGGGSLDVDIIKLNDLTVPTDENIFSSLRTLKEIEDASNGLILEINDMFLRKDIDDTMHGNLLLDKKIGSSIFIDGWEGKGWEIPASGAAMLDSVRVRSDLYAGNKIGSPTFASGFAGWGVEIYIPTATAEMDNLFVRKTFTAYEIVYSQIYGLGGSQIVSDLNKIARVEILSDRYRCYMDDMDGLMLMNLRKGDGVRIQTRTGTTSIKYLFGRCIGVDSEYFDIAIPLLSGSGQPEAGDFAMRWGNNEDTNRQGLIYLTTADSGAPFIDVYDGITGESTEDKLKVRLGHLTGIRTQRGDQLSGYGGYFNGIYVENSTYVLQDGNTIEQTFIAMNGKFESTIGGILDDMSNQSGNILVNSSFSQNTNYWTSANTVHFINVNSNYLWMDGSFYVDKEAVADIYNDGGQNRLRIRNTYILQQNALFRLPERTEVSEEGYTYSFSFKYKVLRAGTLSAGFPGTDLYVEQQLSPSDGYQKLSKVGKWNETGDFELRFTGEILIYGVSLFNDSLADAQIKLQTQIDQTNEYIKLLATKDYVDKETGEIYVHYDSQLQITAEQMSGISTKVDNINNTIESSGWITEAQGTTIFAKKDMENGSSIVNAINVGTGGILIQANRINLVGAVSFSMLSDYTTINSRINGKADISDVTNALRNYVTNSSLNEKLDDYALSSALSKYVTSTSLSNQLKSYATQDYAGSTANAAFNQLKNALVNGSTAIIGGMISTNLLDVDSIFANMASIGGFTIQNNGIFSDSRYSGQSSSKFFLYSSGSSAFLGFSSSGKWAGLGLNTLPATLGGTSALLRLEHTISQNDVNYGAVIDAHGGKRNYALYCTGGLKVNGAVSLARLVTASSATDVIVNNIGYKDTFVFSVSAFTSVWLPSRATITSKVGNVYADYGESWSEVGFNAVIFIHIIVAAFSPQMISLKAENSDTPLVDNDGNTLSEYRMGKGDCIMVAYHNQRWYTFGKNF